MKDAAGDLAARLQALGSQARWRPVLPRFRVDDHIARDADLRRRGQREVEVRVYRIEALLRFVILQIRPSENASKGVGSRHPGGTPEQEIILVKLAGYGKPEGQNTGEHLHEVEPVKYGMLSGAFSFLYL